MDQIVLDRKTDASRFGNPWPVSTWKISTWLRSNLFRILFSFCFSAVFEVDPFSPKSWMNTFAFVPAPVKGFQIGRLLNAWYRPQNIRSSFDIESFILKPFNFHRIHSSVNLKTSLICRQFLFGQYIDLCATFHSHPNINLEQSFRRPVCSLTIFHMERWLLCWSQYQ